MSQLRKEAGSATSRAEGSDKQLKQAKNDFKAQLESSEKNFADSQKEIVDVRLQLELLQATEKSLIAQLSAARAHTQQLERNIIEMQAADVERGKEKVTTQNKVHKLEQAAARCTQEVAEAHAAAKAIQRHLEQAQVQIARMEKDMHNSQRSKESGIAAEQHKSAAALTECVKLREELRTKQVQWSCLDFAVDQSRDRAAALQQQIKEDNDKLQKTHTELGNTRQEMRTMSEESARNRIQVEELEKALAKKDAQIGVQIKVLRNEKEDLQKVAQSLREERRVSRGELLKQKGQLDTFRSFSTTAKETVHLFPSIRPHSNTTREKYIVYIECLVCVCTDTSLFCADIGLFCADTGLFCTC